MKKKVEDKLFIALNTFHPNINLTLEENPTKFLDTRLTSRKNGSYTFQVVNKSSKLPFHFFSQVPLLYKRSVITGKLHRQSDRLRFQPEKHKITAKFTRAGYPYKFLMNQFKKFEIPKEELLIPPGFFDERTNVHVKIPFCPKNEREIRKFLDKQESYTNFNFRISYFWLISEIRTLFPNKDKLTHHHHVIYKGVCSCNGTYIGKTLRNATIRWAEYESDKGNLEPAKHLNDYPSHSFTWSILERAPSNYRERRMLEAYHIKTKRPTINDQLDIKSMSLFCFGIT